MYARIAQIIDLLAQGQEQADAIRFEDTEGDPGVRYARAYGRLMGTVDTVLAALRGEFEDASTQLSDEACDRILRAVKALPPDDTLVIH